MEKETRGINLVNVKGSAVTGSKKGTNQRAWGEEGDGRSNNAAGQMGCCSKNNDHGTSGVQSYAST